MISTDDKLLVNSEINNVILMFAKETVLKGFLESFSFAKNDGETVLTQIFVTASHASGVLNPDVEFELIEFISSFMKELPNEKKLALRFWVLNINYHHYYDEISDDTLSEEKMNTEFGRILASKLYEPEKSGLNEELYVELTELLIGFSGEFDLSCVDDDTYSNVKDNIETYCIGNSSFI